MPFQYTDEQKQEALRCLIENEGNVPLTSTLMNIPRSTLYRWINENKLQIQRSSVMWDAMPNEWEEGEFSKLYETLMQHLKDMSQSINDDPDTAHLRIMALSRFMDRVLALRELVRDEKPSFVIIAYEDPDGTLHRDPVWAEDRADEDKWYNNL